MRADEKLTAFLELESALHEAPTNTVLARNEALELGEPAGLGEVLVTA